MAGLVEQHFDELTGRHSFGARDMPHLTERFVAGGERVQALGEIVDERVRVSRVRIPQDSSRLA
jgi:hypothetical protein